MGVSSHRLLVLLMPALLGVIEGTGNGKDIYQLLLACKTYDDLEHRITMCVK